MDLLQTCCRSEESNILRLQQLYTKYGYSKFRMSKFEDYTLYLQNKNFLKSGNIITFNGPSGRLLALKQDITLSIVKNARDADAPHKVYYVENVYRASDDANDIREITQTGVEYIGDIDVYAMSEIILLALKSLQAVSDRCILGISHMGLVRGLLNATGLSLEKQKEILSCIRGKSVHELKAICEREAVDAALTEKLSVLAALFGKPEDCFDALSALAVDTQTADCVQELKQIYALLCETGNGDSIRIDFSVANDMQYYNGITFQGFVDGAPQSVLSGGRYDALLRKFGRKSGAIGFAVYLDLLSYDKADKDRENDILVLYDPGDICGLAAAVEQLQKEDCAVCVRTSCRDADTYSKIYRFKDGRLYEQ